MIPLILYCTKLYPTLFYKALSMKKIFIILFLPFYLFALDFIDISIENKQNHQFEDYIFIDTNESTTQDLIQNEKFQNLNIEGNFYDLFGFSINRSNIESPNKYENEQVYLGSPYLKFFSLGREKLEILHDVNNSDVPMKKRSTEYTMLNFIVIKNTDVIAKQTYTFSNYKPDTQGSKTETAYWKYNLETRSITSELFYETVKEDAIKKNDYVYPVAISKNFTSWFRLYGVAILSIEQYDYSKGEVYIYDENGTKKQLFTNAETDPVWNEHFKVNPIDARFQGIGIGYKLTAEAYYKDLSFYITSFYKKIKMDNQYSPAEGGGYPDQIVTTGNVEIVQKYTSFGLRYRF